MHWDTPNSDRRSTSETAVSRRSYLRTLSGGVGLTGSLALAADRGAAAESHADAKPAHVSITSDAQGFLDYYRPLLDTRNVPIDNHPTLYGWKATSPEWETDVAVYCAEYAVQRDVIRLTSHAGDHEWIYVYVDSQTGEVRQTSYTAYHWLRGYIQNPPIFESSDDGKHVQFLIAPTYHNYIPLPNPVDSSVLMDVSSLGDYDTRSGPLYRWLDNGMAEDMARGAVHNPWLLDADGPLDAWWAREGSGRVNRYLVDLWAFIGLELGIGWQGSENVNAGDAEL